MALTQVDSYSGSDKYGAVLLTLKVSPSGEVFCGAANINPHKIGESHLAHGSKATVLKWSEP